MCTGLGTIASRESTGSRFRTLWNAKGGNAKFHKWLLRYLDSSSISVNPSILTATLLKDFPRHCHATADDEVEACLGSQGEVVAAVIKQLLHKESIGQWRGDELQTVAAIEMSALGKLFREQAQADELSPFSSMWKVQACCMTRRCHGCS